jgi:hypothetical protein
MTLKKLGHALQELSTQRDQLLVGFDACLMGMVEVYFEIQKAAGWVVGGADEIPTTGWPYQQILSQLEVGHDMSPKLLAQAIVRDSLEWYNLKSRKDRVSLSACELKDSLCDNLAEAIRTLGIELTEYLDSGAPEAISAARCYAEDYKEAAFIDLRAFCWKIHDTRRLGESLQNAAGRVYEQLEPKPDNKFVIDRGHSNAYPSEYMRSSGALSICFPRSLTLSGSTPGLSIDWGLYKELNFNRLTGWHNFLNTFYESVQ